MSRHQKFAAGSSCRSLFRAGLVLVLPRLCASAAPPLLAAVLARHRDRRAAALANPLQILQPVEAQPGVPTRQAVQQAREEELQLLPMEHREYGPLAYLELLTALSVGAQPLVLQVW